jgi:CDP-paratose 2-epimerase
VVKSTCLLFLNLGDHMMKILIVGGCGFLGSNLASFGIRNGYDVTIFDNLSRVGAADNLKWLQSLGNFKFIHGDTRNRNDVDRTISEGQYDAVLHLAGQVAMTTSISDPYKDFQINAMGTFHVLDAIRRFSPKTIMTFSSTNKVYGDLEQYTYRESNTRYICDQWPNGFDESVPLDFHSPYGCSKGAADQYMLDFARIYNIRTIVFRHSSMYGGRQFATYDQGWVGWFCEKAIEKKLNPNCDPFTISGNGKQVRDILHAEDMIRLYYTAINNPDKVAGQVFNIGGGMEQSLSLLELFSLLEELLDVKLSYIQIPPRISDQKIFVADISKINRALGWKPQVNAREGVKKMIEWAKQIAK